MTVDRPASSELEGGQQQPPATEVAGDPPPRRGRLWAQLTAVVLAAALVVGTGWWGRRIGPHLYGDTAAPLLGRLDPRWSTTAWIPLAVAALSVVFVPVLAARLRFGWLVVCTWVLSAGWAFALAGVDGSHGIVNWRGIEFEYLAGLPHVHGWGGYLAHFTEHVNAGHGFVWPLHVAGNPPGALLFFSALDHIGLRGTAWASVAVIVIGTSGAAAAAWCVRTVVGEPAARRAAPFLALAPMAIWMATSADAVFVAASAWGVALIAAGAARRSWRGDPFALGGGLLLGQALYMSYGIAPMCPLVVAVALALRRVRPLLFGAVGVAAVAAIYGGFGFWWWQGLDATMVAVHHSVQSDRSYVYFLVADFAELAVAVGPATVAGVAALRRMPRLWWLVGGALIAAVGSDVTGISRGEVERIWLPFMPWLIVAAATLGRDRSPRPWIAAQAGFGALVQLMLVSFW